MIKQDTKSKTQYITVQRGIECGRDLYLVTGHVFIPFKCNKIKYEERKKDHEEPIKLTQYKLNE